MFIRPAHRCHRYPVGYERIQVFEVHEWDIGGGTIGTQKPLFDVGVMAIPVNAAAHVRVPRDRK